MCSHKAAYYIKRRDKQAIIFSTVGEIKDIFYSTYLINQLKELVKENILERNVNLYIEGLTYEKERKEEIKEEVEKIAEKISDAIANIQESLHVNIHVYLGPLLPCSIKTNGVYAFLKLVHKWVDKIGRKRIREWKSIRIIKYIQKKYNTLNKTCISQRELIKEKEAILQLIRDIKFYDPLYIDFIIEL